MTKKKLRKVLKKYKTVKLGQNLSNESPENAWKWAELVQNNPLCTDKPKKISNKRLWSPKGPE